MLHLLFVCLSIGIAQANVICDPQTNYAIYHHYDSTFFPSLKLNLAPTCNFITIKGSIQYDIIIANRLNNTINVNIPELDVLNYCYRNCTYRSGEVILKSNESININFDANEVTYLKYDIYFNFRVVEDSLPSHQLNRQNNKFISLVVTSVIIIVVTIILIALITVPNR